MDPPGWRQEVSRGAEREIVRLSPDMRRRVLDALRGLITDPPTGDIKKIKGTKDQFRLRVGEWRVIFHRVQRERVVAVVAVKPRGGAYGD